MANAPQAATDGSTKLKKFVDRFSGVGFVMLAFLCWWLFAWFAEQIIAKTCTALPSNTTWNCIGPRVHAVVMVITLCLSLWASSRIVFPPED